MEGAFDSDIWNTYILPSGGLYNPYHLLGEPETAIEHLVFFWKKLVQTPSKSKSSNFFLAGSGILNEWIMLTQMLHEGNTYLH